MRVRYKSNPCALIQQRASPRKELNREGFQENAMSAGNQFARFSLSGPLMPGSIGLPNLDRPEPFAEKTVVAMRASVKCDRDTEMSF